MLWLTVLLSTNLKIFSSWLLVGIGSALIEKYLNPKRLHISEYLDFKLFSDSCWYLGIISIIFVPLLQKTILANAEPVALITISAEEKTSICLSMLKLSRSINWNFFNFKLSIKSLSLIIFL